MADELLTYYEQELSFIRQMGAEFAVQYPKIAARLLLEPNRCEDPHVERLIQSFALLAARIAEFRSLSIIRSAVRAAHFPHAPMCSTRPARLWHL